MTILLSSNKKIFFIAPSQCYVLWCFFIISAILGYGALRYKQSQKLMVLKQSLLSWLYYMLLFVFFGTHIHILFWNNYSGKEKRVLTIIIPNLTMPWTTVPINHGTEQILLAHWYKRELIKQFHTIPGLWE